jgi:sporulation protein YlmC with PRC-barrel domain
MVFMLVLKERIVGVPVMSLQTGTQVAHTQSPIIDPRYLNIYAFYCDGPQLDSSPAVLHVEDVREVSSLGFIVDSADVLMSPDDLVRLKEVIGFNFELVGKLVVDDTGRKLGRVKNYTVDTAGFGVTQLSVAPSFWQAMGVAEVLIHRQQIVEVTDARIVVRSPSVKAEEPAAVVPKRVIDNPFRHPSPQPDASVTNQQES